MRTRRSRRTSLLAYDPEVERSARLRRKAVRQFSTNLDFAGLEELFTEIYTPGYNTTKDGVRLRFFPFSLKDQAKAWFTSLEPGSIHSWSEMQSAFLDEFYSISKTAAIRNKIKSFRQIPGEQFHEAFTTLKELLRTCPHHDVPKWELVKVFYDGMDYHNQQFVMATSGDGPEHVSMVTSLRNGKTYNNDIKIPSVHDFSHDAEDFVIDDEIVVEGKKADNVKSDSELVNDLLKDFPKPPTRNPEATESPKVREGGVSSTTTPYLAALEKSASARLAKRGPHSEDMWETFKLVKINLPLIDAIKQISAYAKFLKDLCTQKRKMKATLPKKIDLTEHLWWEILPKKALLDLDASINILPASLVDKYDLGTLRKTDTIISLADRSTKIPRGILEDVIVKVDDFYYPVDFFVMDTESPYKDVQPTIILGRPFHWYKK
ncbi:DNA-directed DNA polymerase [Tanacetum coccineum]|uniref:DNA-directed DNA polymerase n=1 Tax=Tanacetum coccineum TaxID=301880 RepID=A0ABQ5DA75_9ASTR